MALVEPMSIVSLKIGRELDPITPCSLGGIDSGIQKLLTNAPPTEVRMDVHGLHFRTETSAPLEMSKHFELAHPNDFTVQLSY